MQFIVRTKTIVIWTSSKIYHNPKNNKSGNGYDFDWSVEPDKQ